MIQDLTLKKTFIRPVNTIRSINHHTFTEISINDLTSTNTEWDIAEVIETGDYEQREQSRLMKKLHDNIIGESLSCERCGDPIVIAPWNFGADRSCLCNRCKEELEAAYGPCDNISKGKRPWDITDKDDASRPLDNILLWD